MNYLYLPTCVNATSVSVMSDRIYIHATEFIYISQVDACIQIHDINNVKLIIIMKMLSV